MALRITRGTTCRYFLRKFSLSSEHSKITTAAIIVIGDEILKGEVPDTNSTFLAKELHSLGLQLKKISVIGDEVKEVCEEVKKFSDSFDYVLTTGGIGPTHDDITYEAVALAFNEPLHLHPQLKKMCMEFYNTTNINYPGMKLAYVPKSAQLNFNNENKTRFPNVSIKNVYMFPGIPELLKKSFNNISPVVFKCNGKFYSKCLYINLPEDEIVEALDKLVEEFPDVRFGSYPKLFHSIYKVKVTIESCNEESTLNAYKKLLILIPKSHIVFLDDL